MLVERCDHPSPDKSGTPPIPTKWVATPHSKGMRENRVTGWVGFFSFHNYIHRRYHWVLSQNGNGTHVQLEDVIVTNRLGVTRET